MANAFGALRSAWGLSEWPTTSGPTYSNHTLDASNDGIGFVFRPETLNPITHVGVRYGVATGTPPEYKTTMEVLDDNAFPNAGTDIGGGSPNTALDVCFTQLPDVIRRPYSLPPVTGEPELDVVNVLMFDAFIVPEECLIVKHN